MSSTASRPQPPPGLACGEVRGGNGIAHDSVVLPGLQGVIYSRPCLAASGGDIHYLSRCGSGLMSRICLADVSGHGDMVGAIGREIHTHLRRSVDVVDERKVFRQLNDRLSHQRLSAMTTAVLATYYPPSRRLTVSYAGHPRGWLFRRAEGRWTPLTLPIDPPKYRPAYVDVPLGLGFTATYHRHRFKVDVGDRLLLITDGVLDTTSPEDAPFDASGVEALINGTARDSIEQIASRLIEALHAHAGSDALAHDDVTFFLADVVPGPPGPALWHVVKNRLLSRA